MSQIAVVTGANRGLGLAAAIDLAQKGYTVYATGRDAEKVSAVLSEKGLPNLKPAVLDVSNQESIDEFTRMLASEVDHVDALINNAGQIVESNNTPDQGSPDVASINGDTILKGLQVNTVGPYRLIQAMTPLLKKSGRACVVNVSSGMAALDGMDGGWPAYRISKTALNAVTRIFHHELRSHGVKVNSVCPGWVRTDMGGPNAQRSLQEGIKGIIWAATLPEDGPSGGFFRDGEAVSW